MKLRSSDIFGDKAKSGVNWSRQSKAVAVFAAVAILWTGFATLWGRSEQCSRIEYNPAKIIGIKPSKPAELQQRSDDCFAAAKKGENTELALTRAVLSSLLAAKEKDMSALLGAARKGNLAAARISGQIAWRTTLSTVAGLPATKEERGKVAIPLLEAAHKKYSDVAMLLGQIFFNGAPGIVEPNKQRARQYFSVAARLGDRNAMATMAFFLEQDKDDVAAMIWLRKSAALGNAQSKAAYSNFVKKPDLQGQTAFEFPAPQITDHGVTGDIRQFKDTIEDGTTLLAGTAAKKGSAAIQKAKDDLLPFPLNLLY